MSAHPPSEHADTRTIVETASAGQNLSILAAAVKAADLVNTLASPGPFTVFAPSDAAFAKLPAGEVDQMFKPENKLRLANFVTYHILAGQLTVADLRARAQANNGQLTLRTVEGDTIDVTPNEDGLHLVDQRGLKAAVMISDMLQSNGVIHVTDSVLSPSTW